MITKSPLSIDELAAMAAYMNRYSSELVFEATEGAKLDEDPHDVELRQIAIDKIDAALKVVREDLAYRLEEH